MQNQTSTIVNTQKIKLMPKIRVKCFCAFFVKYLCYGVSSYYKI